MYMCMCVHTCTLVKVILETEPNQTKERGREKKGPTNQKQTRGLFNILALSEPPPALAGVAWGNNYGLR